MLEYWTWQPGNAIVILQDYTAPVRHPKPWQKFQTGQGVGSRGRTGSGENMCF